MSALEQRLEDLGRELAFPPQPDLAPPVLARLDRRPFPWRAVALAAAALAVVAVAAVLSVPQARSAILRFFHLGGATVTRVEALPPTGERTGLGRPVSLQQAERQVGFRLLLPPLKAPPERVYVVGDSLATVVLRAHGGRVLLSEFPSLGEHAVQKLAGESTRIEPVTVAGRAGVWISGTHTFAYFDRVTGYRERPVRVHGNVLLWVRGDLTLRLEGRLTKPQALSLARSVR